MKLAVFILFAFLTLTALAQMPDMLFHSIPAPFGTAQFGGHLGYSVAVNEEGGLTVVGAPTDDIGGENSGVVKVFDSTTGALLHLIPNPSPAADDGFGYSVAISGTRVVVGAHQDDAGALNAGSTYVFDLDSATPTVPLLALHNPSPGMDDQFGYSVAISGVRVVVGVRQDDAGASNAGSAYLYNLDSATPTVPHFMLNKPTPAVNDNFGYSVAISETHLVVGAIWDDTGATNSGSAYVYELGSGTPTVPVVTLNNPSPALSDHFGVSVAVSGTQVVVGAFASFGGANAAGIVYVYDVVSGTPTVPVVTLNNPSPASNDHFGTSVAISGSRVVVGADLNDTVQIDTGSAYVYDLSSDTPTVPVVILTKPSPAMGNRFGGAVAISGSRVLVGAYLVSSTYLFDVSSDTPTVPVATLNSPSPSAYDHFGYSVAIYGSRMVVGTPNDNTSVTQSGSAYVYDLNSDTPTVPLITLNNPSPALGDCFGWSVAISGRRVVVGAYQNDAGAPSAGSAYVYDLGSDTPSVPVATLNNPSPGADDQFGYSVAISGGRVVVGALNDNTGASAAGSAYVYDVTSDTPTVPLAVLNNPNPEEGDHFGTSVAISGGRVVVGSPHDNSGASDAGRAYVYELSSVTPSVPVATLRDFNPAENNQFGNSVAISDTRVVVGAHLASDTFEQNSGKAYVFDLASGKPTDPVATLMNPSPATDDQFGYAVAISGKCVVVGTPNDYWGFAKAGSAFVYDLERPMAPVATLNNPGPGFRDNFGFSVAIHGASVAVGVPFDDSAVADKGFVYIYGLDPKSETELTDFGSRSLFNDQSTREFTIRNYGDEVLNLTGSPVVEIMGDHAVEFKLTRLPATVVGIGESSTFEITFDPSQPGLRTATVSIATDVPTRNPIIYPVSGFGVLSKRMGQSIAFTAPGTMYQGEGSVALAAEASSGLPVTLEVVSGPGTLVGSIFTPTGVGKVTVRAMQAGGGNYAAAKTVTRVITVKADPSVLTLTGLSQRYDGLEKEVGTVGGTGMVEVSYQVGGVFGPAAPTEAGRYAVRAVADGVTKTGTLVIAKAPLYVVPEDKRKFAGEVNPVLSLVYEGFVGGDDTSVLTSVPVLATAAKVTSPGGVYPITAKGGAAANYALIYRQGTLVVESFAAGYEALLVDESDVPSGKLSLTVAKSGKSFSGSLALAGETTVLRVSGPLVTNSDMELATGEASVLRNGVTYAMDFTLPMDGEVTGAVTREGAALASAEGGRRLLALPKGGKVNYSGAHTAVLEPAQPPGTDVPAGAGWARATINTRGAIALVGKLGDGTTFTSSLLPDAEEMPGYRLWVQPYKPARVETFLGGTFVVSRNALLSRGFVAEGEALVWAKAARAADKSYPDGFANLAVGFTLDPWIKPSASQSLAALLGLSGDSIEVAHSQTGSDSDDDLPTTVTLSTRNGVSVPGGSNPTKWKTQFNIANGTFTGSFELLDAGVKRVAPFSGVLRQPSEGRDPVIGDGHFLIPVAPGMAEILSGEVLLQR